MYNNADSTRDGYPQLEASIQAHFNKAIDGGKQLFTTDAEDLYELYLANLPEENGLRQHYTCNGCRQFINRYGGLVTVDEDGIMRSAIWDEGAVPELFVPAVIAMRYRILNSNVNGVFIPDARVLGVPKTGEWTHVHVRLPQGMVNRNVLRTAYQVSAERREDYNTLRRVSSQHTIDNVDKVIALLNSETVYRGERYVPAANWFREVLLKLNTLSSQRAKNNYLWLAASKAPTGFIPSNSSNVGQTLNDINNGLSLEEAGSKLAARLNPATFQRAQSAPTANKIRQDEKTFQKLADAGIVSQESLRRRYAKKEEVPTFIWQPKELKKVESAPTGVFGHLTPKDQKVTAADANLPTKVMTYEKFARTTLPMADKIEVLVDNPNRFAALVTAANPDAPNILQWDNTFSWYYHGGVDAEIRRRLAEYGAQYEGNEIRASLAWEGLTDLDFHAYTPNGYHIMFNNKRADGGYLDLDMNGIDKKSKTPVENIRWEKNAPIGRYRIVVHNYSERVHPRHIGTPFQVELEINGKVYRHNGKPLPNQQEVTVFQFDYRGAGQDPIFYGEAPVQGAGEAWVTSDNGFVEVTGITNSPNLWGEKTAPQAGTHIFFLLKDVKDESEGAGRGFFNEHLIPELREIRRTLEHFAASATIEGAEEATACGVGYSKDQEWNVTLKVTSGSTTQLVKIDRWD